MVLSTWLKSYTRQFRGIAPPVRFIFTVRPPGIDANAKATERLMHYVCRLARFMPVDKIQYIIPISTSTARRWDKIILTESLPDPGSSMVHLCSSPLFTPNGFLSAFSFDAHHNRSLRMQLKVVWHRSLLNDTERPALISDTACSIRLTVGGTSWHTDIYPDTGGYPKSAEKSLNKWISWAKETELQPLITFAKGLDRDRDEILSFIRHRITSAKLEAFNATISRIVKRACGYRDLEYLFRTFSTLFIIL